VRLLESAHDPGDLLYWHVDSEVDGSYIMLYLTERDYPADNAGERNVDNPFSSPSETRKKAQKHLIEIAEKLTDKLAEGFRTLDVPTGLAEDIAAGLREAGWGVAIRVCRSPDCPNPRNFRTLDITDPNATPLPDEGPGVGNGAMDPSAIVPGTNMTAAQVAQLGLRPAGGADAG
jgi:hypothetical protein